MPGVAAALAAAAHFKECVDFDAKRQFLVGHVERVIYKRYKVMIAGFFPVQSASEETKLQLRIEGEIDQKAVSRRPRTIRPIWPTSCVRWLYRRRSSAGR